MNLLGKDEIAARPYARLNETGRSKALLQKQTDNEVYFLVSGVPCACAALHLRRKIYKKMYIYMQFHKKYFYLP